MVFSLGSVLVPWGYTAAAAQGVCDSQSLPGEEGVNTASPFPAWVLYPQGCYEKLVGIHPLAIWGWK